MEKELFKCMIGSHDSAVAFMGGVTCPFFLSTKTFLLNYHDIINNLIPETINGEFVVPFFSFSFSATNKHYTFRSKI